MPHRRHKDQKIKIIVGEPAKDAAEDRRSAVESIREATMNIFRPLAGLLPPSARQQTHSNRLRGTLREMNPVAI